MKLCEYYDPWENIQTINNPSVRVLSLSTPARTLLLPSLRLSLSFSSKGAFMLNFWGQNQRFQTWLEQNAVASMLIFE